MTTPRIADRALPFSLVRLRFPDAYEEFTRADFELRRLRGTAFNLFVAVGIAVTHRHGTGALVLGLVCIVAALTWYRKRSVIIERRKTLEAATETLVTDHSGGSAD